MIKNNKINTVNTRPLNKKQQILYRRLSIMAELILQTFEDLEREQKDKRFRVSKHFEQYRQDVDRIKVMSENILEIIFKEKELRSSTYFNDLVKKIDTVIRKEF